MKWYIWDAMLHLQMPASSRIISAFRHWAPQTAATSARRICLPLGWGNPHMEKNTHGKTTISTSTMNPPFFLARRSSKRINMMAWWRVPPAGAGRAAKAVPQAAGSWASPVFLKKSRGKPSNAFTLDFFSVCFFLESRLDCQQQCIWRWAGQDLSSAAQPTVLFWI